MVAPAPGFPAVCSIWQFENTIENISNLWRGVRVTTLKLVMGLFKLTCRGEYLSQQIWNCLSANVTSLVTSAFILYTHVTAFLSFWNASKWNTAPVKSSAKEAKIQFNLRYVRGSCIEKWEISTKSTSSYFKRNGFIVEVKLKKQWCDYFAKAEFGKLTPCLHWRINC